MSADLLIYGIVAAGLVFWLRSVLGTRHGDERERPNPFTSQPENQASNEREMPARLAGDSDGEPGHGIGSDLDRNMAVETAAEQGLMDISRADRTFEVAEFLRGAQGAFTMIVESFAQGDRETLKGLLNEPVYKAFESVIDRREKNGETASVEIHSVRRAEIIDAQLQDKMAYVTVRFVADETNVLRDSDGEVIEGNPDFISETIDIWVFGRPVKSRDPTWLLFETRDEDAADEDHKTVPDAEKDASAETDKDSE